MELNSGLACVHPALRSLGGIPKEKPPPSSRKRGACSFRGLRSADECVQRSSPVSKTVCDRPFRRDTPPWHHHRSCFPQKSTFEMESSRAGARDALCALKAMPSSRGWRIELTSTRTERTGTANGRRSVDGESRRNGMNSVLLSYALRGYWPEQNRKVRPAPAGAGRSFTLGERRIDDRRKPARPTSRSRLSFGRCPVTRVLRKSDKEKLAGEACWHHPCLPAIRIQHAISLHETRDTTNSRSPRR